MLALIWAQHGWPELGVTASTGDMSNVLTTRETKARLGQDPGGRTKFLR